MHTAPNLKRTKRSRPPLPTALCKALTAVMVVKPTKDQSLPVPLQKLLPVLPSVRRPLSSIQVPIARINDRKRGMNKSTKR